MRGALGARGRDRSHVDLDLDRQSSRRRGVGEGPPVFTRAWLDDLTALTAVVDHSGSMELATTIALPTVRGPLPLAKGLAALHVLSGGRVVAGVGAGSSPADLATVRVAPEDRWRPFDLRRVLPRLSG